MKKKVAFITGRFQPIHKGHQLLVDKAFSLSKNVVIMICSAQESRTKNNPLSFEERKNLIKKIYPDAIIIPVQDMGIGNNEKWGDFLLSVLDSYGYEAKFFVTGEEKRRVSWFKNEVLENMEIISISRNKIVISGTEIREAIKNDDYLKIKKFVPNEIANDLMELKKVFIESEENKDTKSI